MRKALSSLACCRPAATMSALRRRAWRQRPATEWSCWSAEFRWYKCDWLRTRTADLTVTAKPITIDTQSSGLSDVVEQQAIQGLPLNGRRFTDLALLSSAVVQDPRGLTSDSNGDLSFGGVRGFSNNFQVDGADDNNTFYAQANGRYRAPYQFSNEVIKEFRVSSNSYSAEQGRAGGAVFNVATKSGTNQWHGTDFYYLRDRDFDAQQPYATSKPDDRQQQFGATLGGPIRKDRFFLCRIRRAPADRALDHAIRQRGLTA